MGLLGDIYSAIDTKKRQVKGLLDDFGGTVDMGVRRFREDQQGLQNLFANAYPMAGDKTVLNSPEQIAQFQREAGDAAANMGLAGTINTKALQEAFPTVDFSLMQKGNQATLSKVVVPKAERGQGTGKGFMQALTKAADEDGAQLALSPSGDFGGSKSRLVDFYKQFGFVPNKGRTIDHSISESMRREAVKPPAGLLDDASTSYRGGHTAPMKGEGAAPLHDLAQIYPDDIYSSKAAQYYGHFGDARDNEAVWLMQQAKNKPNMPVTMYRAVPHEPSQAEQLALLEKQMAAYQRRGVTPDGSKGSGWFNSVYDKREQLRKAVETPQEVKKLAINNGDWVTLSKNYAKEHGESALNGNYKIISKKVPARKLFTDGNSIQEFGYDESGKINAEMLKLLAGGTAGGLLGYNALKE